LMSCPSRSRKRISRSRENPVSCLRVKSRNLGLVNSQDFGESHDYLLR
jgi:hypothetical protein